MARRLLAVLGSSGELDTADGAWAGVYDRDVVVDTKKTSLGWQDVCKASDIWAKWRPSEVAIPFRFAAIE